QSNYQEALEYYLKSLAVMETLDNQPLEGVFNSIVVLYQNLRNQEQALVYFDKARRAAEKNGNRWVMGAVAMAMSNYYMDEAPAQALAYANEALENFKAEGDVYNEILSLLTIGHCYRVAGNLDEAITYAQAGLVLAEQSSFPKLIAEAEADLSNIHYDRGEYVESMAHAGRSWAIDSTEDRQSTRLNSNHVKI